MKEEIKLRQETEKDFQEVEKLIESAFKDWSEDQEHLLVQRLRQSPSFIPELSIVAEANGEIAGHILLTKVMIKNEKSESESLTLAPVSVKPSWQNQGVGGKLILESHRQAKALNYKSIIVLGHENYYPKFGYQLCKKYGIKLPFDAPDENCLVIELLENGLEGVRGIVQYDPAFFEKTE